MKNTTYLILAFLVCQLSFSKVTVDPVMPALPNMIVCDDNNDGMALFNLSSQDAYIISGQSSMPSSYIVTYHLTLSGANNGTSAIASPASYLGSNGQVIYARIINIATGFFAVGPFSLIVNSKPIISNKTVSICSGGTFVITPTNALPDIVPIGTTYTWIAAPTSGITGSSNQAIGVTSISQTLANTTSSILNVVYNVTATTPSGCSSTFTITVSVVVAPIISNQTIIICSGSTINLTPFNGVDVVPIGTTYTWTVDPSVAIIGASDQSVPQTSITQTLINSSNFVQNVVYHVTATSNTCSSIFIITVTVNPKPSISSKSVTICSGGTFYVTPTNTLPDVVPVGTTYAWSAPVYSSTNISDGSAQTVSSIFVQTLTNSGNTVETATYTVTAISNAAPNSCSSVFTITVTINPSINLPVLPDVVACNSYTLPPLSNGNYFTAPNGTGIMMSAGTVITSTQMIFIHASNGVCTADESYVVIINPSIVPTFTPISPLCLNSPAPPFQLISNEGISGTWTPSIIDTTIPGNFVYTFIPDNTITGQECAVQTTVLVTVLPSINLQPFPNVVTCSSFTLPVLSVGNYFTGPNATGTMMFAGTEITSTQMIYVHATNGTCTAEESYFVTIYPSIVPTFAPISPLCDSSVPPVLPTTSLEGINGTWSPSAIDTSVSGSFVYTFTPDNTITGQECAVPTTILVIVLPSVNPIITGTDNSNIVYVDYPTETVVQPLLLTATTYFSTDNTYQWYLNGTAISGATDSTFLIDTFAMSDYPRVFNVIVTSVSSGCIGESGFEVIQTAVPAPSGFVSQTFTPGQTLADLVVAGTNVLWYSSLTGRNTTSTPLPSNTLLVDEVTYYASQTINGYESPTRLAVTVHSTLSNDSFGIVNFKYSPNPVNDYLFIQAKETIKTVTVYNTLGQLVFSQDGNSMEVKLDLSQLKSGNYFVKIQSDLKQDSFKIIKK